jgi:hypothetical protein
MFMYILVDCGWIAWSLCGYCRPLSPAITRSPSDADLLSRRRASAFFLLFPPGVRFAPPDFTVNPT